MLVRLGKDCPSAGRPAAVNAPARSSRLIQWQAAYRSLRLGLDLRLALAIAAPPGFDEAKPRAISHNCAELIVVSYLIRPARAKCQCLIVQRLMNLCKQFWHTLGHGIFTYRFLCCAVRPWHQHHLSILGVAWPDLNTNGHATQFPIIILEAWALFTPVGPH